MNPVHSQSFFSEILLFSHASPFFPASAKMKNGASVSHKSSIDRRFILFYNARFKLDHELHPVEFFVDEIQHTEQGVVSVPLAVDVPHPYLLAEFSISKN